MLALVEVPEHGLSVFASGGAEGTVWRNGDGVDVSGVSDVVGLQAAVSEVPDLDDSVPSSGNDDWIAGRWRESDVGNPVSVAIISDGVLALSKGVPQLDRLVARSGNDLSVVSGESNRKNVLGVGDELAGAHSLVQVPETKSLVPRSGKSELSVGRDDDVRDEVVVSGEGADWTSDWSSISGLNVVDIPNKNGLVARRRENSSFVVTGEGGDLGNPSGVSLKGSGKFHLFLNHLVCPCSRC